MPCDRRDPAARSIEWEGLGLDYGTVRLTTARAEWGRVARRLADEIRAALPDGGAAIEHVGSTAVPGLVAKPIIDLAVGLNRGSVDAVSTALERLGYEYRGDAGERGGLVLVLEDRPRHRVAHLHVVDYDGPQGRRYLAFRDLLRSDPSARTAYARTKIDLVGRFAQDRKAYTAAKEAVVSDLLDRQTS